MTHLAVVEYTLETADGADAGIETREYEADDPAGIEEAIDFDAGPKGDFYRAGLQVGDIWYVLRTYSEADFIREWCLHCGSDTCPHAAKHDKTYGRLA